MNSVQDKKTLLAQVAAEVHSYISDAAAAAPPLVIHVQKGEPCPSYLATRHAPGPWHMLSAQHAAGGQIEGLFSILGLMLPQVHLGHIFAGKDLLPQKSGRRLKELIQRLAS